MNKEAELESNKNEMVWGTVLEARGREVPNKIFLECDGEEITFGNFNTTVNAVANALLGLGLKKGATVCVILPNCVEFLYCVFGLIKVGAIAVPLNTAYRGDILSHVINNSEAEIIIIDREYIDRINFIEKDLKFLKSIIIRQGNSEQKNIENKRGTHSYLDFRKLLEGRPIMPRVEIDYLDPMIIMYTSGTTGLSKGAVLLHKGCYFSAYNHAKQLRLTDKDVLYTCLPLFHGIALILSTLSAVLVGGKLVLGKSFSASTFWKEIKDCKATYFPMVGAMAHILFKLPPAEEEKRNSVRVVYSVPAPASIYSQFEERFGVKLIEAYGATDGHVIVYQPYDNPKIGACGKVIDGFELKIVNDRDENVAPNTAGEIVYRSHEPYTMCPGYFKNPQATVDIHKNFWFHSGDTGLLDEEGYLHFVDRKRDSLRRRGENISSYEIEKIVNLYEDVLECATIGVPSDLGEDDVKVVIVPREGKKIDPLGIMRFCEIRMPYYMVPRYIEFKSSLPKTPNEKVQKYKLREEGITPNTWDSIRAGYKVKK